MNINEFVLKGLDRLSKIKAMKKRRVFNEKYSSQDVEILRRKIEL